MPYFFAQRSGDRVTIAGADARHLARSLRARPGETIQVVCSDAFGKQNRLVTRMASHYKFIGAFE